MLLSQGCTWMSPLDCTEELPSVQLPGVWSTSPWWCRSSRATWRQLQHNYIPWCLRQVDTMAAPPPRHRCCKRPPPWYPHSFCLRRCLILPVPTISVVFLLVPHSFGFREGRPFPIYSQTWCEERLLFHHECSTPTGMDNQRETSLLLFFPFSFSFFFF